MKPFVNLAVKSLALVYYQTVDIGLIFLVICSGLYLGNARAACDQAVLRDLNITHILTIETHRLPTQNDVNYLFIRANDAPSARLMPFFPMANAFIDDGIRKGGNVLVHCHFGVSRSATLVIAYIMAKYRMTYDDSLALVRSKRKFINPNYGFVQQLKEYESRNYQVGAFQRFEAYVNVNARKHKYKLAYVATFLVAVIVPIAVVLG